MSASLLLVSASVAVGATPGRDTSRSSAGSGLATGGTGTAKTLISLPSLVVDNPLVPGLSATLGTIQAAAASAPNLLSGLSLQGVSILGHAVPGQDITSASGRKAGNLSVPVTPASGALGGALAGGALNLANYLVEAAGGTATAQLGALTGGLQAAPLSLSTSLGNHGLGSVVSPSQAASTLGLATPGLSLGLADLLPTQVLDNLPLGTVFNLVQALKLPLPTSVASQVGQVVALAGVLNQLSGQLGQLSTAQGQLSSLSAASTPLQPAQQAVTSAVTQVTSLLGSLGPATPVSPALTSALGTLNGAWSNLVSQAGAAGPAGSPLASVLGQVQSLTGSVQGLLGQLTSLAPNLPDLSNLLGSLQGLLKGAPLLDLGQVALGLTSSADGAAGHTGLNCTLGSLSLLGSPVPLGTSAAGSCNLLAPVLGTIQSSLTAVLGKLPVLGLLSNVVSLGGMTETMSATPKPGPDGVTTASAGVTPLALGINPLNLTGAIDPLLSGLLGQVNQVLGSVGGAGASGAQVSTASALPAVGTASALPVIGALPSLLGVLGPTGLSSLTGLLGTLTSQLDALPTGLALGGLSTLGLKASLIGASTQASFTAAAAAVPGAAAPSASGPQATAGRPTASAPTPVKSLPFTGAATGGIVALGMLALAGGAHLLNAGRRSRTARPPV